MHMLLLYSVSHDVFKTMSSKRTAFNPFFGKIAMLVMKIRSHFAHTFPLLLNRIAVVVTSKRKCLKEITQNSICACKECEVAHIFMAQSNTYCTSTTHIHI